MGDSFVTCSVFKNPANGTRIYSYFMNWLFRAHSIWQDALFILDKGGGLGPASTEPARLCSFLKGRLIISVECMWVKWGKEGERSGRRGRGNCYWHVK